VHCAQNVAPFRWLQNTRRSFRTLRFCVCPPHVREEHELLSRFRIPQPYEVAFGRLVVWKLPDFLRPEARTQVPLHRRLRCRTQHHSNGFSSWRSLYIPPLHFVFCHFIAYMFRYVLQLAKESLLEVHHAKEFRRDNLFCHVRATFPRNGRCRGSRLARNNSSRSVCNSSGKLCPVDRHKAFRQISDA